MLLKECDLMLKKYNLIVEKYGLILDILFIMVLSDIGLRVFRAGNTIFPILAGILIFLYMIDMIKRSIKYIKR